MELIIDTLFRSTYSTYFKNQKDDSILNTINRLFQKYDSELIADTINIIKTAITLGMSYEQCHSKITKKILTRFPVGDDIDFFIIAMTIKVMIARGIIELDALIYRQRDIDKEATATHFRIPVSKVTEDMIEELKNASSTFTYDKYSINDTPVSGWDEYFYNVAMQAARNSKCLSRRIGAVLVKDKSIIGTGYNGPPRGLPRCDKRWLIDEALGKEKHESEEVEGKCPRYVIGTESGGLMDLCPASHAEVSSITNAARMGICVKDATMFLTCGIPCCKCLPTIINAGIKEIVVTNLNYYDELSKYILKSSDLKVRLYDFM